jgi:hypothetical protein
MRKGTSDRGTAVEVEVPSLCLLDSANLSLAPDIVRAAGGLTDSIAGSVYRMNQLGARIGEDLATGTTFGTLVRTLRQEYGKDEPAARADLNAFISNLHAHRLVSIRQSYLFEVGLRVRQVMVSLVWLARLRVWPGHRSSPQRRYPATPGWIVRGCLEAHQPTVIVGSLLALLAASAYAWRNVQAGLPGITSSTVFVLAVVLGYWVGLGASAILHEFAHYWAARRCGVRVRSIFVRMGVCGISHEPADPLRTGLVSAAGPTTAVSVMWALCVAVLNVPVAPLSTRLPVAFACLLIGAQHLPSLTPFTTEGRSIVRAAGQLLFATRL